MNQLLLDLTLLLLLIVANGLFAMTEVSLVAARKVRLRRRARQGDAAAARALSLAEEPETFLATVQIGITLVGVISGAFGGARIAAELATFLSSWERLTPYAEELAFALVVTGITYLSLVIGELVPKQVGLKHPEPIARLAAGPMVALSRVASPLVSFLGFSSRLLLRLIGERRAAEAALSADELHLLIEEGAQAGVLPAGQRQLLLRALALGKRRVATLMVPRREIVWLDAERPPEENRMRIESAAHHHFPVCRGDVDDVLGVVALRELWSAGPAALERLAELARPALFVPESASGLRLFELLRERQAHVALVVDEYGSLVGLAGAAEVAAAVFGEIAPLTRDLGGESPAVERGDGSWLLDGDLTLVELRELLPTAKWDEESRARADTLAGVVLEQLGRLPQIGDAFEYAGHHWEVVDMDGPRVDRLLVRPAAQD